MQLLGERNLTRICADPRCRRIEHHGIGLDHGGRLDRVAKAHIDLERDSGSGKSTNNAKAITVILGAVPDWLHGNGVRRERDAILGARDLEDLLDQ